MVAGSSFPFSTGALMALLCIALCALAARADRADELRKTAMACKKTGDYQAAIRALNEAISLNGKNASVYFERGLVYRRTHNYKLAIADFKMALAVNPKIKGPAWYAGKILADQLDSKGALPFFDKELANDPQSFWARFDRAGAYIQLNEFDKAERDLTICLNSKHAAAAYKERGILLMKEGRAKEAVPDLTQWIERAGPGKEAPWRYMRRAQAYDKLKEYAKAAQDWTTFIVMVPKNEEVYTARASDYQSLHRYSDAIGDYSKLLSINPTLIEVYKKRAELYVKLQKYQQAVNDYTKFIDLRPEQAASAYGERAAVYDLMGKHDLAAADRKRTTKPRQQ